MIAALLFALCAQAPAPASTMPRIDDIQERHAFEQAQTALQADETLLAQHRGLHAFLAGADDVRQAEDGYLALMELPSVRGRVDACEEVLRANAAVRADFERYFARLRRDSRLREAVETLHDIEMAAPHSDSDLPAAFDYLRAHADVAVAFTTRPERMAPTPEPLRPLREAFHRDGSLQSALRDAWTALDALAGSREAVYPWWARVYGGGTAAEKRIRALETEFAAFPSRKRAWEERQMAWAAYPEMIAWRDYLYALVRRSAELSPVYFRYLRTLRNRPDIAVYVDVTFTAEHGTPPAWPPAGVSPTLPAWTPSETLRQPTPPKGSTTPLPKAPTIPKPEAPGVQRPNAPARPTTPEPTREPASTAPSF